jgi:ribulose-phosphate 3-epimerase
LATLEFQLGVKTDPVEYRYSYEWLFRLLAEEGIHCVQLGSFFEIYQLPDEYFLGLRRQAEDFGIRIASVFTAHRELGGFFADDPAWEAVALRNYRRLIEVGALVGAQSVGSNPGAVYRDRMGTKPRGIARYLGHMKELMRYAHEHGVPWLTIEPMSCLAEPPTLPDEIAHMADALDEHHRRNPATARVGFCADISHGYADRSGSVRWDHLELLAATLPHLYEIHLKNTDAKYCSTFGFGPAERDRGIVRIEPIRQMIQANAAKLPGECLVGYLEIGGPKLGRDYSDPCLEEQLRASLAYLKEAWLGGSSQTCACDSPAPSLTGVARPCKTVRVSPSLMCADLFHLEHGVRQLEAAGADMLHLDLADGHFVPNLLLGLDVVRQLRPKTGLPLDVHLMVDNPDVYLEPLAEIGADWVAVHAEACRHLDRTLAEIARRGMKPGVALNPATPLEAIAYVLERLGYVLLMTVNPGFAGQTLAAGALRKIADCRRWLDDRHVDVPIMVDGNVSFENIPAMVAAGADILVAGTSSWFHRGGTLEENVRKTHASIAAGLEARAKTQA